MSSTTKIVKNSVKSISQDKKSILTVNFFQKLMELPCTFQEKNLTLVPLVPVMNLVLAVPVDLDAVAVIFGQNWPNLAFIHQIHLLAVLMPDRFLALLYQVFILVVVFQMIWKF